MAVEGVINAMIYRFEVAMDDRRCVEILEPCGHLKQLKPVMSIDQRKHDLATNQAWVVTIFILPDIIKCISLIHPW